MFPEQENLRQNDAGQAVSRAARNGAPHTTAAVEADRLQLRVSFACEGEYHEEGSRLLPLSANRWERLKIPLPADWQGGGLRLQPGCRFGLLEIVGVRVVSGVMGESLWEMLGRDLLGGVRVSAGMQVLSNKLRLRLLCTGDEAQIVLPDLALPSAEFPLVLELGVRVRTELASIGYTLHEWVDDANTTLHDALGRLAAAETARTYNEEWAKSLLTEVEVARADGDRREAALQEQLTEAHAAARTLATTLTAEIATARAHGEEQAATLLTEIDAARADGRRQVAALESQLATARAHGEERAATLLTEIDAARADGNQREAALQEQLTGAQEAARMHAATLTAEIALARAHGEERAATLLTEIDAARADGNQREAALQEQLTGAQEAARMHAATLTAEIALARAHGEERAAALTAEIALARAYGEERAAALTAEIGAIRAEDHRREAALQEKLTGAREAARTLAEALAAGVALARAQGGEGVGPLISKQASALDHGDAPASARTATIDEVRRQIERSREQMLELRERTVILQGEAARQQGEVQRLEQTLSFSNQQKANVQAELVEARRLAEEHRGRVLSMRRSLSWKLTLPLRIIGRALTGRRPASRRDLA